MKTILGGALVPLLLLVAASTCFADMGILQVSMERAKEMGLEIRTQPAGPNAVWVELEFESKGELKTLVRVELVVEDGGKLQLSSALKEEQPKPGHVTVSFSAARTLVDKITLRMVTGSPLNYTGHDLRLKDFVELEKGC